MIRSISEPSLGTIGNSTIGTNVTKRTSRIIFSQNMFDNNLRGKCFWKGRLGVVTQIVVQAPRNIWYQAILLVTIVCEYVLYLLLAYYLDGSTLVLDILFIFGEIIFLFDVFVLLLHAYWPLLRLHIRVNRKSCFQLFFDVVTLIPVTIIFRYKSGYDNWLLFGRWLKICRIYRLLVFFRVINGQMHTSRKLIYLIEHFVTVLLILHASTCMWYGLHASPNLAEKWNMLSYPKMVSMGRLEFRSYVSCGYYCACRLFNIVFGDAFPLSDRQKWLTSGLMLFGYVFIRYRLIGSLAWEMVLENNRRSQFVDRYQHMIKYLKECGASCCLKEQAKKYIKQLWEMKNGVLTSRQLQKLPHPLQMELIFDINVDYFHNSLLFRDTSEAFMRQISLLMRHELFLAGQHIWSQGVVKNGMICIKQGVIEMLSDEDDESPMISFKEGTEFISRVQYSILEYLDFMIGIFKFKPAIFRSFQVLGELSLFYSIPSKVTVQAATYVELQVLRRTDFMRVIAEYPNVFEQIREKIKTRLQDSQRKQIAIMKYDEGDSRLIRTRYRPMKVLKDNLAGVEEEDPTFVDDSHMYYKDENNIRQTKFTTDYLELYEISRNVTTIDYPCICLKSKFPWILEPNTGFTRMWDTIHFVLVLYICVISPHTAIVNIQTDLEKVLNTIVVSGLLLNIYIQLTTAIVHKNIRKETVKEIAEEKMSSFGFYMDILSVFPVHIFTDTLDPNGLTIAGQVAKLFPIVQVWHISDYFGKWENNFNSYPKLLCLMKFLVLFTIFCYWTGSFLYMFACPKKLCRDNSWMSLLIYWETKIFMTNEAKHENPMMSSFAFGTSIFTNTGASDIAPGSNDFIVAVILFTLGMYLSCLYSAKICSLYLLSTQRKCKFKESIRELFYFLNVNRVSGKIKTRVEKFYCVQWYYNNDVSTNEIFKEMSTNIQQEILSVETVEILLCCPLFQECSRDFLQTVAANTRTIVLPDNEVLQHAADIGRDMYILQKGHCNLLNSTGKISMSIGPGCYFGVIEMLFGLPKVYTVVTSTNCILLHLDYTALVQCWGTFPDISQTIITVLEDPELCSKTKNYEDAKPLTGRMDNKTNRIAQEIKESFVVLNGREERADYVKAFQKLGIMRHLRYIFVPVCITPHGIFLKFWCTVRFCLAVFYIITVPYDIATRQHKFGREYNWTDIVLYFDLILMSYVAYYDNRSLLITHPLFTLTRYLKHAFLLDLISVFPFEQVIRIVNENTDIDFYRINRILLVTRITSAFTFWESDIMGVNPIAIMVKFLPIAISIVNLSTTFIFRTSCVPFLPEDSYFLLVNCTRVIVISNAKYDTKYALIEYTNTFYWVYEIFVGLGCTPIAVMNNVDVWLIMALQITGFLYFAFMFGYVASTRSAAAHALLEHSEKTRDLENFLYQENVDAVLTAKTLKYFEYVWTRTNGSNPQQICRGLNSALMEDTLVFMYERALREVPMFGKVERSFIRVITKHLHEMYFVKGDTIIQCRDIQSNIYIIYRGKVDVLTSYNEMITCMGPGGMFGNFTGQPISCSEVTVYASRSLDLLVLPSQTFFNLVKYYPKIQDPLNKAFEVSRDYILPITMDIVDDDTSEESEVDLMSWESNFDSRSGSSKYEISGQISVRSSTSTVSQGKSSTSTMTYRSYTHPSNLLKPGTLMFQAYGYITCIIMTANYAVCLYEMTTLNDCYLLFWFQAVFDIYFYIKIFLTIHQGYINKHGEIITNPNKCRRRYFKHKSWVWTDLFVNLPLELFGLCFPHRQVVKLMHYLRINKLLRLKYLIEFYRQTSAELTNNLTVLQSTMTIIVVFILIHTFTCIWLLTLMGTSPISIIRTLKLHLIDEETPESRWDYTTSFYVVVSVLTTTGGDEIVIVETIPMSILAVILVCGKTLAAIVIATAIQVAYATKYALNNYEKVTGELIDMLKNQGLSSYQMKKLWVYVQQLWVTERGRQLPELLEQTPYVRRCDLMSAMFGQHLRNSYLFADTEEAFLRQLTARMEYTIFFTGNYIVVAGDCEARMYWVHSGTVSVVSVENDLTETTHEILEPGDVFGILQGINRGVSHTFSYRAETKVSVLSLNLESWINILPHFPEANRKITERTEILFTQI